MKRFRHKQQGLTLIEVLIALVLGLLIVSVIVTAVQSQFRTSRVGSALSRAQSQGRFAIGDISAAIKAAGYRGCAGGAGAIPLMPTSTSGAAASRSTFAPIQTFRIDSAGWQPSTPEGYTGDTIPTAGAGTPIVGTHALLVEGGTGGGASLASSTLTPTAIVLSEEAVGITEGAMALVSDCAKAEAFVVDSVVKQGTDEWQITPKSSLIGFYDVTTQYPETTMVFPYRQVLYYIGESGRVTPAGDPIRSLFEHVYPFQDSNPQEIVEGVEAFVVSQRQQQSDGKIKEFYAGDSAMALEGNISLHVSLLVVTPVDLESGTSPQTYTLSGLVVDTDGTGPTHPDDQRIRKVYETTVNVRNAGIRP